jgi:hypothetical protein
MLERTRIRRKVTVPIEFVNTLLMLWGVRQEGGLGFQESELTSEGLG